MVIYKRSSKSYEERLQDLNPKNRLYVEEYLSSKHGNSKQYKSQIFRFAEYFNQIPIDQIEPSQIDDYISSLDVQPSHLVNISRYLYYFLTLIPSQDLNISRLAEIARKYQKEVENKEPISLNDVITFRNKLIADKDYKTLILFELLYVYGLDWEDFKDITKDNYFSTGDLEIKSRGKIKLTETLQDLLNKYPEFLNPKSYGYLARWLRDASTIFENSITETVIKATRNKYFPTCQRCNHQYPNTSEYWALVECKDDALHNKWILCVSCANEIGDRLR